MAFIFFLKAAISGVRAENSSDWLMDLGEALNDNIYYLINKLQRFEENYKKRINHFKDFLEMSSKNFHQGE